MKKLLSLFFPLTFVLFLMGGFCLAKSLKDSLNDKLKKEIITRRVTFMMHGFSKETKGQKVSSGKVSLQIRNLIIDKEAIYIKLLVVNNSANTFDFEGVNVNYQLEDSRKVVTNKVVEALFSSRTKNSLLSSDKAYIVFAIPWVPLVEKAFLVIEVREERGPRLFQMKIPAKDLLFATRWRDYEVHN